MRAPLRIGGFKESDALADTECAAALVALKEDQPPGLLAQNAPDNTIEVFFDLAKPPAESDGLHRPPPLL